MTKATMRWWQSGQNLGFLGTVVATIVAAIILDATGRVPIVAWSLRTGRWLVQPVPVPLLLLAVMIGELLVVAWRAFVQSMEPSPPIWLHYKEDNFLEMVWRWHYDGHRLAELSIRPYCPRCETALRFEEHGYVEMTTSFICDECRFSRDVPGSWRAVRDRLCRLIEREANRRSAQPSSS